MKIKERNLIKYAKERISVFFIYLEKTNIQHICVIK